MNQPTYYTVLPADVRYDKNLSDGAKILYSEILTLSKKEGHCWADNDFYADLFGKHKNSISRLFSELVKGGFIKVELERTADGTKRKTYPLNKIVKSKNVADPLNENEYTPLNKNEFLGDTHLTKTSTPLNKNEIDPLNKNVKYNNTSIVNNTSINNFLENLEKQKNELDENDILDAPQDSAKEKNCAKKEKCSDGYSISFNEYIANDGAAYKSLPLGLQRELFEAYLDYNSLTEQKEGDDITSDEAEPNPAEAHRLTLMHAKQINEQKSNLPFGVDFNAVQWFDTPEELKAGVMAYYEAREANGYKVSTVTVQQALSILARVATTLAQNVFIKTKERATEIIVAVLTEATANNYSLTERTMVSMGVNYIKKDKSPNDGKGGVTIEQIHSDSDGLASAYNKF